LKRQRFPFIISPYELSRLTTSTQDNQDIARNASPVPAGNSVQETSMKAPGLAVPEREFFKHLVPILDGLEAVREAIASGGEESWLKGLDLFRGKLHELLGTGGFRALAKVGDPFDPALHEAIGAEPGTGLPEGAIAQVVQQGWKLGDLVLRYAKVTVARNC
jgi:hypothetical protein